MRSSSHVVTTNKPTPSILQAGCPSCHPAISVEALNGKVSHSTYLLIPSSSGGFQSCLWPLITPSYLQSIKFIISVAHCRLDFTKKKTEKIQAQCYLGGGLPSLSPALWNQYPVFYSASWSVNAVCSIESSFVRTAKRVCTGQQATTADSRYGECESEINIYVSFLVDFHHLGQFIKHSNAFYIYFLPKF